MQSTLLFLDFLNPENVIRSGGLVVLLIIVFAESGLFFAFFLPGDSLLFIAGMLSNSKYLNIGVWPLTALLVATVIAGSVVGYFSGKAAASYFRNKKDNFFYKRRYVDMTREFYQRHGMTAFIIGRFLPIIRTFVTILAGMTRIEFKRFFLFNSMGAVVWVCVMVLSGHWLGNVFPGLTNYLEIIVAAMVVVTAIPVVVAWSRRKVESSQ